MAKLWQTAAASDESNAFVDTFTAADDQQYDNMLLPRDIEASQAHAKMLRQQGILTGAELDSLLEALDAAEQGWIAGELMVTGEDEDCHTVLEHFLTEKCGDAGKKIHTGRSRNDQVLVAMRLQMKHDLDAVFSLVCAAQIGFQEAAVKYSATEMPGYTHMQKAMPTTVGAWFGAFADAVTDQIPFLEACRELIDQNPLGSASGFGIRNFSLDRELTARELGFSRVQTNPLYCGLSRGLFEWQLLSVITPVILICSRFNADLLFFTSDGRQYFLLPDFLTTGSSIMPQKKNADPAEIFRGKVSRFLARKHEIEMIQTGLLSGYNRDISLIKGTYFEAIALVKELLGMAAIFAVNIVPNEAGLTEAMTEDLFVTEKIYELVKEGMPFREAHGKVKDEYFGGGLT